MKLLDEMFGFMTDGFLALQERVGFINAVVILIALAATIILTIITL